MHDSIHLFSFSAVANALEYAYSDIDVIAINDLGPVETNAHLLQYDSVHGRFPQEVVVKGDTIDVGRGPMTVTAIRNPADLPWSDVDVVLECSGVFNSKEQSSVHLKQGARKVLTVNAFIDHAAEVITDWNYPGDPIARPA